MILSEKHNKSYLQRISSVLLINGGFLDNPGLYSGETGLVLFFFHYARHTQNGLYRKYSFDLIEKIQNRIHQETPINYKQGLSGIGSTIEYLVKEGYIEADTDEALEDIDNRIFFTYNLPNLPIDEVISIGYYANWRMSGSSSKKDMIRQTILTPVEDIMRDHAIIPAWRQVDCKNNVLDFNGLLRRFTPVHDVNATFDTVLGNLDLGIQNGLAGLGLSLLTELDGDYSWISLFPEGLTPVQNESLPV